MSEETLLNVERKKRGQIHLPNYTLGEELISSISHGLGAAFGIVALVLCVVKSVVSGSTIAVVSSCLYGSMPVSYTHLDVYKRQ